jgi:hypothetical protein
MRRILLTAAAVGLLLAISARGQEKHSAVGTWKVDIAKSDFGSDPKPKSITVVILKDTPEMLSWRVRGMDKQGRVFAYSWKGPEDGSMHPVMQNGKELGKQSAKREDDGSMLRHGEFSDGTSFDARSKISDDGNTMTEEASEKYKDGKETKGRTVYHRVIGAKKAAQKKEAVPST